MHIGRHAHSRIRSWSPQNTSLIYFANALMVTHVLHCALQWQCFLPTSKTQAYKCNNPSRKPPLYKEPKSRSQLRDLNPHARRPPSQSSDSCSSAAKPAARPRWNVPDQAGRARAAALDCARSSNAAAGHCAGPARPGKRCKPKSPNSHAPATDPHAPARDPHAPATTRRRRLPAFCKLVSFS